jgi:hypothetical protein
MEIGLHGSGGTLDCSDVAAFVYCKCCHTCQVLGGDGGLKLQRIAHNDAGVARNFGREKGGCPLAAGACIFELFACLLLLGHLHNNILDMFCLCH